MTYDFSDAKPNDFECIPDNTTVPLIFKFIHGEHSDDLHPTKDGRARMVKGELVVTEGQFAKRKIFLNLLVKTSDDEDEGHAKACEISRSTLRAIIEAARGYAPTDETPAAVKARQLAKISDLDGMEFWGVVGIEKGKGTYSDKNVLKRVLAHGKEPDVSTAAEAKATRETVKKAAVAKTKW